ncbi:thioredoxin family protein [Kordiimonas aestuarii]|uniref:thioredoxin family protein n=1 Tax=Kordiimonas aestuarii TaxID=1005925 RepID=UPI0021D29A24|nr:thioredoxin family protein [Kordiimonas aestuarii]
MHERQQTSLAVVLWTVFGGAVALLVTAPAPCVTSLHETLTSFAAQISTPLQAEESNPAPFKPSADSMADVDAALARARANGKLAIIVLGANWCHDSQGLIHHFQTAEMQKILTDRYELLLLDVGYLQHGTDVVNRFGQPVIYGTPTVFVVDPATEQVINRKRLHQWRAAASISLADTIAYFDGLKWTEPSPADTPVPANLEAALEKIKSFEEKQARRIAHAYEILGPLVAMERDERPDNFYDMWEQVRVLRYKLTDDLTTLRAVATRQAAYSDKDIELEFPQYQPFDWE